MTSTSTVTDEEDVTIWLSSEESNCSLLLSGNSSMNLASTSPPSFGLALRQQRIAADQAVPDSIAGAAQCSQESVFLNPPAPHLVIQGSPLPSPIFCSPTVSSTATTLLPAPPELYMHSPAALLEPYSNSPVATYRSPTPHTYLPTLCPPSQATSASYSYPLHQLDSPLTASSSLSSPISFCSPTQSELYLESPAADCTTGFDFRSSTPIPDQLPNQLVTELLTQSCCSRRCLAHLSVIDIERCRKWFGSRSTTQQNQFLLETFQISGCKDPNQPVTLEGKALCKKAFTSALDISIKRYDRLYSRFCDGAMQYQRKPTVRSVASKVSECKAWMKRFFSQIGDSMPHINQIHLPHVMTKREIYVRMMRDLTEEGIAESDVISQSYFYYIWNKHYKNVVIPVQNRFSKCDLCTKFAKERMKPEAKRTDFQEEYASHLQLIEQERKKYHLHREKARAQPDKYVTLIIDGMDQSKTNIPALTQEAKSTQNLYRLRTHLTGALIHTQSPHGKHIKAFYDFMQWAHDSNLIIQVLSQVLHSIKENLPPTLYLQLDNCSRENKNKYFLGFCCLLVEKEVFRKVRLNFLPVGHTHEDVDQFFSKVSQRLKKKGAESFSDLLKQTTQSTTPEPESTVLTVVHDFKSWIGPCLEDIHGHSTPHCFKFIKVAGVVKMFYKHWTKDPWCEEAIQLLKTVPTGVPATVCPKADKLDLPTLEQDIPKFFLWISPAAAEEWNEFLADLPKKVTEDETHHQWVMEEVFSSRQQISTAASTVTTTPDSDLANMFAAEQASCEVYTGPYRPRDKEVHSVEDTSALSVGDLVAVVCDNCDQEPTLAKVEAISDGMVDIVWLNGEYGKAWNIAKHRDPRNRGRMVEWKDTIPIESIILFAFELTTTKHLRKRTIEHLKKIYLDYRLRVAA